MRLAVFTRRTEIRVMKTVGATNRFVRASFAIEGILLGIIGAALAYGLVSLAYVHLFENAVRELGFLISIPIPFASFALPMAGGFGLIGVLMGFFGSTVALRRYLKV